MHGVDDFFVSGTDCMLGCVASGSKRPRGHVTNVVQGLDNGMSLTNELVDAMPRLNGTELRAAAVLIMYLRKYLNLYRIQTGPGNRFAPCCVRIHSSTPFLH